jgi:hypothetical protein
MRRMIAALPGPLQTREVPVRDAVVGSEGTSPSDQQEATQAMKNTFLDDTTRALRELERRQQQRARLDLRAQRAFDQALGQHDRSLAGAAAIEGTAWRGLLAVPGMTVSTAAALCGVSMATVHRRMKEAGDER